MNTVIVFRICHFSNINITFLIYEKDFFLYTVMFNALHWHKLITVQNLDHISLSYSPKLHVSTPGSFL